MKILALVEAISLELYKNLADGTDNAEIKKLLLENGREELAHGHRVAKALKILTGKSYRIPPIEENPMFTPLDPMPVTRDSLSKLAEAELSGGDLYAGVAASFDNPDANALFRQNGKEEVGHGHRLMRAVELLTE